MSDHTKSARQRYVTLKRWREPNDPEILAVNEDLDAERIARAHSEDHRGWQELTPEQKSRIATMLRFGQKTRGGR